MYENYLKEFFSDLSRDAFFCFHLQLKIKPSTKRNSIEEIIKKILKIGFFEIFDLIPMSVLSIGVVEEKKNNEKYCKRIFKEKIKFNGVVETFSNLEKTSLIELCTYLKIKNHSVVEFEMIQRILDEISILGLTKMVCKMSSDKLALIGESMKLMENENEINFEIILEKIKEKQKIKDFYFF
jgi:hypothetical protein